MPDPTRANALDRVVVVLFENRSLDNVLGRLYGPADGKTFEGVIGKELSNPIPGWAEHGADRKVVPYGVSAGMDSPNPDSGEEWYHVNTQLFGTINDHNRGKIGEPDMLAGHGDYHPAFGRSFFGHDIDVGLDAPSSMLGGEAFLARVFSAYRSATSAAGANVWNTTLLIGWDEPGGTYDHVPPGGAAARSGRTGG